MKEALKKISEATKDEVCDIDYDEADPWMVDAVETHETIDDFIESSAKWNERTVARHGTIAGFRFICWNQMQAFKGDPRRQLSVIDLGEVRFALECNLKDFE